MRKLTITVIVLLAAVGLTAGQSWAIDWDQQPAAREGDRPAAESAPGQQQNQNGDQAGESQEARQPAEQSEEDQRINRSIGLDWGDKDKSDKPEDPNMRQPGQKVDLSTALDERQQKLLENIQKIAADGDELAALAAKTKAGENERIPKERSLQQFNAASVKYLKAHGDLERRLGRAIQDDDTRLTLYREYGDTYRRKAAQMLLNAGHAAMEFQNNPNGIKTAVTYFKRARAIDESHTGWRDGYLAAQSAMRDLVQTAQQTAAARNATTGGGGATDTEDDETIYGDNDYQRQRREASPGFDRPNRP